LVEIDLHSNRISSYGAAAVAEYLWSCNTVENVDMSNNECGDTGAVAMVDSIINNQSSAMKVLDMRKNGVKAIAMQTIADSLAVARPFSIDILLADNRITSLGPAFLSKRKSFGAFHKLDLSSCEIKSVGAGGALRGLSLGNTILASLDLSQNDLGDVGKDGQVATDASDDSVEQREFDRLLSGAPAFLNHLAIALPKMDALKELKLFRCNIGAEGARKVSDALALNPRLEVLDLRSNKIGDDGVKSLVSGLRDNSVLTALNLEENEIQSDGGIALASLLYPRVSEAGDVILNPQCTLKKLDLKFNSLSAAGASAFSAALASPVCPLEHLGIGNNGLGVKGAEYLREAIQPRQPSKVDRKQGLDYFWGSPNLQTLVLTVEIPVGDLRQGTLDTINWENRRLADPDLILLSGALAGTSSLTELRLKGNKFTPEGVKVLMGALAPRPRGSTKTSIDREKRFGAHELLDAEKFSDPILTESEKRGDPICWPPLKVLDLSDNQVRGGGVIAIAEYLQTAGAHTLRELLLGNNNVRNRGAQEIAKALKKDIRLEYSPVRPHWRPFGILDHQHARQWVGFKSHGGCPSLNLIDLSNNAIEDEGVMDLAEAVALSTADVHLSEDVVESYTLCGDNVKYVTAPAGAGVARINLSHNDISYDGVEVMIEGLSARRELLQRIAAFVEEGGHWQPCRALCVYHMSLSPYSVLTADRDVSEALCGIPSGVFSSRGLEQIYLRESLHALKETRWKMVESVEEVSFEAIDKKIKGVKDRMDNDFFYKETKTEEALVLKTVPIEEGDDATAAHAIEKDETVAVVRNAVLRELELSHCHVPHTVVDLRDCTRMRSNNDVGGREEVWKAIEISRNEVQVSNWLRAKLDERSFDGVTKLNGYFGSGKGARKFYATFVEGGFGRGLRVRVKTSNDEDKTGADEIVDAVQAAVLQRSKSIKNDLYCSIRFADVLL